MRNFLLVSYCIFMVGMTVPTVEDWHIAKTAPEHVGVDKRLKEYEQAYKKLALSHNIKFTHNVTIGFSNIKARKNRKNVVGLCTFGKNFREIDVDTEYWKRSSPTQKRTLLYHEMTHCFCHRDHDYAEGKKYEDPDDVKGKILEEIKRIPFFRRQPGFMLDGCPLSVMHPYVLSDDCAKDHWDEYEKEMLERCKPY